MTAGANTPASTGANTGANTPADDHPLWQTALAGTNLIEASAGTGKTWTITGLYLRLIVESRLEPRQLLAVTFTNAATAELKERIRAKLVALRERLISGSPSDDSLTEPMALRVDDRLATAARLRNAIESFDEAVICTIHSYCQRLLGEQAFESALPFDTELLVDDGAIRDEVAQDWWRNEMDDAGPIWARYLMDMHCSPASFLAEARTLLQPGIEKVLLPILEPWDEGAWQRAYVQARALWHTERIRIEQLILDAPLHGSRYRAAHVLDWCVQLDEYFGSEIPSVLQPGGKERVLVRFTQTRIDQSTTKGQPAVTHPFFVAAEALVDTLALAESALERRLAITIRRFAVVAKRELDRRKLERGRHAYDDLIVRLHRALGGPGGEALAARARVNLRAALVDEFQDTDALQFDIFKSIFAAGGLPLFLVGDPKQAIYAFRGADVFAYLAARGAAAHSLSLETNRRSSPELVEAVNRVFAAPDAFVLDRIAFHPARSTDGGAMLKMKVPAPAPLTIWWADDGANGRLDKGVMMRRAVAATAAEIARLLSEATKGSATIVESGVERAVRGSDIAVIVRRHREAEAIRAALAGFRIASVTYGRTSVFASEEAAELGIVLAAIAMPGSESRVRAALATTIFGMDLGGITRLGSDDAAWELRLAHFTRYHTILRSGGVMRMWREIVRREGVASRYLGTPFGARSLTNLQHLIELLHDIGAHQSLEPAALPGVLARLAHHAIADVDEAQLRLESDAALVRVLTVHTAKGLEFPLVFCPFLWDGKLNSEKAGQVVFHDPAEGDKPVIDLGSEEIDRHRERAIAEELAESVRLAYVAMTRAKFLCYLAWGNVKEAASSPLAWLFHNAEPGAKRDEDTTAALGRIAGKFNGPQAAGLRRELESIAGKTRDCIKVVDLPDGIVPDLGSATVEQPVALREARVFSRPGFRPWRVSSFSSLVAAGAAELPDHDAATTVRGDDRVAVLSNSDPADEAFRFPRGARAGSCLHAIFEAIDPASATDQVLDDVARAKLLEFGLPDRWVPTAAKLVSDTLDTPLDQSVPRLRDIPRRAWLTELEFAFPIESLSVTILARQLAQYRARTKLPAGDPSVVRMASAAGYMKGYIDAVFEHAGRYYIVDYKSNWLGDSLAEYSPDRLSEAIVESSYDLQYLIYSVALDRMLGWRLGDYSFERHFGGVFYLFLRGMRPSAGPRFGVFFARPDAVTVRRLSETIGSAAAAGGPR